MVEMRVEFIGSVWGVKPWRHGGVECSAADRGAFGLKMGEVLGGGADREARERARGLALRGGGDGARGPSNRGVDAPVEAS